MCAKTGTVLIGGTAGQSIIFILSETAGDHLVPTKTIDLLEKQDDKVKWKGMDLISHLLHRINHAVKLTDTDHAVENRDESIYRTRTVRSKNRKTF